MNRREEIHRLSVPEKVLLVQDIWDELLEETNGFPINATQKTEI
jgi:putative addiction module component (TIGR02574 family)